MSKEYKAFISYRHLPRDSRVAERLHKSLERYRIPRRLDPEGKRRFGRVFRDREELPLATDLSDSIHEALDHAEYLIVVCSPETPKSLWVREEIRYFLMHHDPEHVIAVLAEGEPAASYPPELLQRSGRDGETAPEQVEPIAADVRGGTDREMRRKSAREFLRIYARLLRCDFDDLYRREQRYRARRAMAAAVAVALVSALFIGMLLNRNAQIRREMLTAMENESRALAALSRAACREGDYRGALNMALDALPGRNGERPYVPEAEYALTEELGLYHYGSMQFIQSVEQNKEMDLCRVCAERMLLAAENGKGRVTLYDLRTGLPLWTYTGEKELFGLYFRSDLGLLLVEETSGLTALELDSGEPRWTRELRLSSDPSLGDGALCLFSGITDQGRKDSAQILDLRDGSLLAEFPLRDTYNVTASAVSPDLRWAALLEKDEAKENRVILLDLGTMTRTVLDGSYPAGDLNYVYKMSFSRKGELLLAGSASVTVTARGERAGFVICFDPDRNWEKRFETNLDLNTQPVLANGSYVIFPELCFFACTDFGIAVGERQDLILLDADSGSVLWSLTLTGAIKAGRAYPDGLGLVLSDGTVTFCAPGGGLRSDYGRYIAETGMDLSRADISGDCYAESVFACVPAANLRRAVVVAYRGTPEQPALISAEAMPFGPMTATSPGGRWIAAVGSDEGYDALHITAVDTRGDGEPIILSLEEFPWYRIENDHLFLTDGGLLLTSLAVIDLNTGSFSGFSSSGELPPSYSNRAAAFQRAADGVVLTGIAEIDEDRGAQLLLWENERLIRTVPLPERQGYSGVSDSYCTACGGLAAAISYAPDREEAEYYRIYSLEEDRWIEPESFCTGNMRLLALAEEQPWMAVPGEEGLLKLYDLRKGELLLDIPYELSTQKMEKLLFAEQDRLLLVFSSEGDLSAYDTETGALLGQVSYADKMLRFRREARYSFYSVPEQRRYLLVYNYIGNTESCCLALDMDSWQPVGFYFGVETYLPESGELLILPYGEGLYRQKLLSREEIAAMAEELLIDNGVSFGGA